MLIKKWYTHVTETTACIPLVIYLGLELISPNQITQQA